MWSVGVILYILLCGFPPFYEEELPKLFALIMGGKFDFPSPWWDGISAGAKDLVKKLLVVEPKRRATAAEVLAHAWIQGQAPTTQLSMTVSEMKKFNARRKLRKAAMGVLAKNRVQKMLQLAQEADRKVKAGR